MQQAHGRQITGEFTGEAAQTRRLLPTPGGAPQRRLLGALAPTVILGLVVLLAFPFSALSLWTGLQTDTPLAYQGLIPILALATAMAHAWRKPSYVWRDTVTELVVALPFMTAALALMYLGTRIGSIYFWYNRSDLLALALFGIGAAIITFGVGAVTRSWFAALFLVLVWPAPYQEYLATAIIHITDATVLAVDAGLRNLGAHGAWSGITPAGDAVYQVRGPDGAVQSVGVDSPCAGAAGMFGFLVVAIPAMYLTTGSWLRKLGWVALGIFVLWLLNVGRIFTLFWLATTNGVQSDLFWWTHASLGVVLFTVAITLMLYLGYRFGFRFERSDEIPAAPSMLRIRRRNATPVLVLATLALAVMLGSMNRDMIDAVGLSSQLADGTPISTFAASMPVVEGTEPRYIDQFDWSRQFFGRDSIYQRFAYSGGGEGNVIWVDSVVTNERERLDLFNVQGCYSFHGYEMAAISTVDVGYGIVAQQMQFIVPDSGDRWVALTWTWPVGGDDEHHERVTILQHLSGENVDDTIDTQTDTLSAFERLFGIGNGRVAVGPEAEEVLEVGSAIIRNQLEINVASQ